MITYLDFYKNIPTKSLLKRLYGYLEFIKEKSNRAELSLT